MILVAGSLEGLDCIYDRYCRLSLLFVPVGSLVPWRRERNESPRAHFSTIQGYLVTYVLHLLTIFAEIISNFHHFGAFFYFLTFYFFFLFLLVKFSSFWRLFLLFNSFFFKSNLQIFIILAPFLLQLFFCQIFKFLSICRLFYFSTFFLVNFSNFHHFGAFFTFQL